MRAGIRLFPTLMLAVALARPATAAISATGGNATNETGGYRIHTFTNSGALAISVGGNVEVLVVAGGGGGGAGGGSGGAGGGGAGGLVYSSAYAVVAGSVSVTVGAGGGGGSTVVSADRSGTNGQDSIFGSITAKGGGGGGAHNNVAGKLGGSGGGGSSTFYGGVAGSGTAGQGTAGGGGGTAAGGGGGSSTTGSVGTATGGNGGAGLQYSVSGTATNYAGGGGGGGSGGSGGSGGLGGGAAGGNDGSSGNNASMNTGGGGGGAGKTSGTGGNGGSGIVIVRYLLQAPVTVAALDATSIGVTNATLNGTLSGDGGDANTTVAFCWGYTDGGTGATSSWDHVALVGAGYAAGQSFSSAVSGMLSGSNYTYRCYATNSTGSDWSDDAKSFTTVYAPSVDNLGASGVGASVAWLLGQVTGTGGQTPAVWFRYWADGAAQTSTVAMGSQAGSFSNRVTGLDPATLYAFDILASNDAGVAASSVSNFTAATGFYVSPAGDGSAGTNWATAFTNLQSAVNACSSEGDIVCVRYGTYSNAAEVTVSGKAGLTIRGGYAGTSPEPGGLTNAPSVLTRLSSVNIRIFNASASTVTLERLTISGGYMATGNGGACSFTNGCAVVLTNCTIANNGFANAAKGGGVYASGGTLGVYDCTLATNYISADTENTKWGGAIACENASVRIANSVFQGNYIRLRHGQAYGGALCLSGGNAVVTGCQFTANSSGSYSTSDNPYGGALYADSVTQLLVTACSFSGNYSTGNNRLGNVMFLTGANLNALFDGCALRDNFYANSSVDVYLSAAGSVTFRGCTLKGSTAGGVIKAGAGTLTVTNSLIVQNIGHGLNVAAGTVNVANSTLAANWGVGITNSGATVTVRDCIVWDNAGGGITGTATVTYSCLQESRAGAGNISSDPRFIAGYYLSSNGLPAQTLSSPCIDAGSGTAAAQGLSGRTTLTDGSGDAGQVDLGYHYTNAAGAMSNLLLYVSVDTGNDTNDGWSAGQPLKTLTSALTRALPGGTIEIAAGMYTNGVGLETFPLTVNAANLYLKGAGAAATIVDARQSGRILYAAGQGALRCEGLTFRNGLVYNDNGAGLYLSGCSTILTNCNVVNNRINKLNNDGTLRSGAGIYNVGGSLTVDECLFLTNHIYWAGDYTLYGQGGGIYAGNASVSLRNSIFRGNSVSVKHYDCYGGAVCLSGGGAQISGCVFSSNYVYTAGTVSSAYPYGGALYANGVNPLAIDSCTFLTNFSEVGSIGGAVYLAEAGKNVRIVSSVFSRNGKAGSYQGDVHIVSGNVTMTNCLVARSATSGLRVAGGTATVVNCTFADNAVYGLVNVSGVVTVRHSIAWGNASAGLYNCTTVSYSDSQETIAGTGNMVTNPLFADTNYYHLAARAGFYSNGWFSGGTWAVSTNDSPLIDAGNAAESWRDEPQPNGRRLNIGAYGGSPVASKTFIEAPGVFTSLTVHSYPATNVDLSEAWLNGEVLHAGGQEDPAAYFCWGDDDAGTTATGLWDHVVSMESRAPWDGFTTNITGFAGTTYYRCYVTNSTGEDWSASPAETFTTVSTPAVSNAGATAIRRTSARLNGAITETGGQNPTAWFHYWPDAGSPTSVVAMGQQAGAFSTEITGLALGSPYHYSILASNAAGIVWSSTRDFATLTADPIGRYVSPSGAGALTGLDWSNAYATVQDALQECTYAGDTIYLRHGTYSSVTQISLSNAPGLFIRGQYAGVGTPGATTNAASVLKAIPPEGNYARVLYVTASTVTFDRVTLRDGHVNNSDGAGLYLADCRATLTNCTLANNRIHDTSSGTVEKGGGIFASGGTLDLFACQFQTNKVYWSGYSHDAKGGAVYGTGVTFAAVGCVFNGNTVGTKHFINYGGALALEGGRADIGDCTFTTNYTDAGSYGSVTHLGGALYASGVNPLAIRDSRFAGNYAANDNGGACGGVMYLTGAGQTATVTRCLFTTNGTAGSHGDICVAGGRVAMTNNLIVRSTSHGLRIDGGNASVVHCTLANSAGWGITNGAGTAAIRNCIAWGNALGGIVNAATTYSCSQEAQAGDGNLVADPLFVDNTYYHLQSEDGYYAGGYFSGGTWEKGSGDSPCIDTGDPADDKSLEPMYSGRAANLGAYGNTEVASKTTVRGAWILIR